MFKREFKKLSKKYTSLEEDFEDFLLNLENDPTGNTFLQRSIERITIEKGKQFFKVRKFVCKSIARNSSNSGIRIIYSYNTDRMIEFEEIEFIEIYHKNIQSNHTEARIRNS